MKAKADTANELVWFSLECLKIVAEEAKHRFCLGFLEHPEDLGIVNPWDQTSHPASIWKWPEVRALGFNTLAFHQGSYGADTAKPTRILYNEGFSSMGTAGWPNLDEAGKYQGPLGAMSNPPGVTLMRTGPSEDPVFRTSAAAAYPPLMCKAIAECCWKAFLSTSKPTESPLPASGGGSFGGIDDSEDIDGEPLSEGCNEEMPEAHDQSIPLGDSVEPGFGDYDEVEDDEFGTSAVDGFRPPKVGWWGKGSPLRTSPPNSRFMRDGGGFCSPGRWPPTERIRPFRAQLVTALLDAALPVPEQEILVLKIILGKVLEPPLQMIGFETALQLEKLLADQGFPRREPKPKHQVIDFGLLAVLAEAMGDPDAAVAWECLRGVPIGFEEVLNPTPAVWPGKTKWKLDGQDPSKNFSATNANYPSAHLNQEILDEEFKEQRQSGMLKTFTFKEAREKFGERLRIASLAIIPEPSGFRMIFDATHRVKTNHGIRIPDSEQFPGPADVESAITWDHACSPPSRYLSLKSDISKAHKRVPVCEKDWGLQACSKNRPPSNLKDMDSWEIDVNTVGTYGIGSAAWWWGRVGALLLRLIHYLTRVRWGFRFADDFLFLSAPYPGEPRVLVPLFRIFLLFAILQVPIKWSKTSGGTQVDWIGFFFHFENMLHGLSASRSDWIKQWILRVQSNNGVLVVRSLEGVIGRIGFSALVLRHVRPFLAPLYAWVARASASHVAQVPKAIMCVLFWLAHLLTTKPVRSLVNPRIFCGELFRADAKAEGDIVVLGGWESIGGELTPESRWFSIALTVETAPWAFWRGKPFRTISALELFASLLSVVLFRDRLILRSSGRITMSAVTDNQGNESVVKKCLTTKFPLCLVLMELTTWLEELDLDLELQWRRRDTNTEADDLTNSLFGKFNPATRVSLEVDHFAWKVLPSMGKGLLDLFTNIETDKREGPLPPRVRKPKSQKLRQTDPW